MSTQDLLDQVVEEYGLEGEELNIFKGLVVNIEAELVGGMALGIENLGETSHATIKEDIEDAEVQGELLQAQASADVMDAFQDYLRRKSDLIKSEIE